VETTATILVVDDQPGLLANIQLTMEVAGYRAFTARDGVDALTVLESQPVDLILADIAMPRMNGYQLFERVQKNPEWMTIPFIFLTARAMDSDIRYGKQLGVDDYLTKPVEPEDLLATVQGKLRRAQQLGRLVPRLAGQGSKGRVLMIGHLRLDSDQHRVWLGEREIELSAREFALIEYLAQRAGEVLLHQELVRVTHSLDTDHMRASALLRPLVFSLRRKLGNRVARKSCIENVRGVGYRLVVPDG
jgi:DNA-binding response OmpR family regulator